MLCAQTRLDWSCIMHLCAWNFLDNSPMGGGNCLNKTSQVEYLGIFTVDFAYNIFRISTVADNDGVDVDIKS